MRSILMRSLHSIQCPGMSSHFKKRVVARYLQRSKGLQATCSASAAQEAVVQTAWDHGAQEADVLPQPLQSFDGLPSNPGEWAPSQMSAASILGDCRSVREFFLFLTLLAHSLTAAMRMEDYHQAQSITPPTAPAYDVRKSKSCVSPALTE